MIAGAGESSPWFVEGSHVVGKYSASDSDVEGARYPQGAGPRPRSRNIRSTTSARKPERAGKANLWELGTMFSVQVQQWLLQ